MQNTRSTYTINTATIFACSRCLYTLRCFNYRIY